MFEDLEDLRKKATGCMIVLMVLLGAGYFWMGGEVSSSGSSAPPKPGTSDEVDFLLRQSKYGEALAASRKLKSDPKPENQAAEKELTPQCLFQIYYKHKTAKAYAECETIAKEAAADYPEASSSKRIAEEWRRDILAWAKEAVEKDEFTLAERLFADYRKDPKASRDICWAYDKYLEKRWPKALKENDTPLADRLFAEALSDPILKQSGTLVFQHEAYLRARWKKAWDAKDMAGATQAFDVLKTAAKTTSHQVELAPFEDFLLERMNDAIKNNEEATLKELLDLATQNQDSRSHKTAQSLVQLAMRAKWRSQLEAGDFKAAEATLQEMDRNTHLLDWKWRRDQLAEYRWERWRKAHDAANPEEARKFLVALVGDEHDNIPAEQLQQAMSSEWSAAELETMGDQLMTKRDPHSALEFYDSAQKAAGAASETLQSKTETALLALADKVTAAASKYVDYKSFDKAESVYQDLVFHRESVKKKPEFWLDACRKLMKLQMQYARHLSENNAFDKAEQELNKASRQVALAMWDHERMKPDYDPWKGVPAEITKLIEKRNPSADAAEKLDTLRKMAQQGRYLVPQAEPVAAMMKTVAENKAMHDVETARQEIRYEDRRDEALDLLRGVLRHHRRTKAGEEAVEELRMGINSSRGQHNFSLLNDLLGFYIAEVGPPAADDPFRAQLKESLQEAAEAFSKSSPMTRIFLLSLLADALPDDPDAKKAREEVLTKGFEVIAQLPAQAMNHPSRKVPSLLPGNSVLCVENKTRYHLMLFLKGPETFYVRLNPFRRGSIVLKDGAYTQAVVVTRDDVIPYRGDPTYSGETHFSGYYIARKGQSGQPEPDEHEKLEAITGDYTLLRAPPDLTNLLVHPDSGLVMKAPAASGN